MIIRSIELSDLKQIREIHEKYYKDEFLLFNFDDKFLGEFVVEEEGKIITAGGIRTIVEAVAVTNKDFNVHKRRQALIKLLMANIRIANKSDHDQLHVFIQDHNWAEQLIRKGFNDTKGRALVLDL